MSFFQIKCAAFQTTSNVPQSQKSVWTSQVFGSRRGRDIDMIYAL